MSTHRPLQDRALWISNLQDELRPYGALDIIAFPTRFEYIDINGINSLNPAEGFIISTVSHVIVVFMGYAPAGNCDQLRVSLILLGTSHRETLPSSWESNFALIGTCTAVGPMVGWIGLQMSHYSQALWKIKPYLNLLMVQLLMQAWNFIKVSVTLITL